eukprot:955810_1
MSSTVDQPGEVQDSHVSQCTCNEEGRPETLPPEFDSNLCREDEAHVKCKPRIQLLLEHDYRILVEIAKIKLFSGSDNLRVFLHIQPSHVSIEESPHGIVGIGISLRVFVVDAMITGPMVNGSLVGDGVAKHEDEADGECCRV